MQREQRATTNQCNIGRSEVVGHLHGRHPYDGGSRRFFLSVFYFFFRPLPTFPVSGLRHSPSFRHPVHLGLLFVVTHVSGVGLGGVPVGNHRHRSDRNRLFRFFLLVLAVMSRPFQRHRLLSVRVAHQASQGQQQQYSSRCEQGVLQGSLGHRRRLRSQFQQLDNAVR